METTERAPYLTIREVAEQYRVVTKTVYRWIAAGLPVLNVGGARRADYRLRLEEVDAWLRARSAPPDDPLD